MKESDIQNLRRIELSKQGIINFRNNTGMGWAGKATKIKKSCSVRVERGDVVVRKARPLHSGLCEGSSDIIGIQSVVITADMIGQTVGVFLAEEIKTKIGRVSYKQKTFIDNVNEAGGIARVVRDPKNITAD